MLKSPLYSFRLFSVAAPALLASVALTGCHRDPNVIKHKYLDSGNRYEKEGKYKEAVIQYSNALKVDRDFADAHFALAKTYLEMGSVMAGYTELLRTVDLAPKNVDARVQLANLQMVGGAPQKAEEQAQAILAMDPNNADGYALQAGLEARKGEKEKALESLKHALALDPNRAIFHTQLAYLTGQGVGGDLPQAESELRKAVQLDPKQVRAHLTLAGIMEHNGDRAGAEKEYNAAVQNAPTDLPAREALAGFYLRGGDRAKGEQVLHKAIDDLPESQETAMLMENYFLSTGQRDRAVQTYADLTAAHPKNVALKIVYARLLSANHQDAKAQVIADELNKNNSANPQVEILNASLLVNAGKMDAAFDQLQKAARDAPQDFEVQMALGRLSTARGDLRTSESAFQAAQRARPGSTAPASGLAGIYNQRGDMNELTKLADDTIKQHPDFADGYLWRGSAEANTKEVGKAEADFEKVLKLSPNSVMGMTLMGQLKQQEGKTAEANALLEKAMTIDPNAQQALNLLIGPMINANEPGKAAARLEEAISKSPQNTVYLNELAGLKLATKDLQGAKDTAARSLQINPNDKQAIDLSAIAMNAMGDHDGAIALWSKWIDAHPKDALALSAVAQMEESKGDKAKAIDYYRKALALDPGQWLASNNLAYLLLGTGNAQDLDQALTLAQTARRSAPRSPDTADTLAWVYYAKGRYASARDLLEDAIKQSPKNPTMQYHLGMAYSKLGDKVQATASLKKAQELDPNSRAAKDAGDALTKL